MAITLTGSQGWYPVGTGIFLQPSDLFGSYDEQKMAEYYVKAAVVRACVRQIATSFQEAQLQIGVYDGEDFEPVEDHESLSLFFDNPYYSYADLMSMIVNRLELTGAAFLLLDGFKNRQGISGVYPIPSHLMKKNAIGPKVTGYSLRVQDGEKSLEREEVCEISYLDPATYQGYASPLSAAIRELEMDRERQNLTMEILRNKQVPGVIVSSDRQLNADQRKDLQEMIAEKISGENSSRARTIVLPQGIKAEAGFDVSDINFSAMNFLTESRICSVFGVPPILVGLAAGLEKATYSNYEQASRSFFRETMKPLWHFVASALTRTILLGTEYDYRFDTSEIGEMQEDATARANRAAVLFEKRIATLNESRRMVGLDPLDGGDEIQAAPEPFGFGGFGAPSQPAEKPAEKPTEQPAPDGITEPDQGKRVDDLEGKARAAIGYHKGARKMARALTAVYRKYADAVKAAILDGRDTEKALALVLPDTGEIIRKTLTEIAEDQARKSLREYRSHGKAGKAALHEIDMIPEDEAFALISPKLRKAIEEQAITLSDLTAETAGQSAAGAAEKIRKALEEGMIDGPNTLPNIAKLVAEELDGIAKWKAKQIAATESSRATHAASVIAAEETGLVQGFRFVVSSDACDLCQVYGDDDEPTGVPLVPYTSLSDAMAQIGSYDRTVPPIHPHCRCTVVPVFTDEEPPAPSMRANEQLGSSE